VWINSNANIALAIRNDAIPGYNWAGFQTACIHETGHMLGIHGHSKNPQDIMFLHDIGACRLSSADVDTLLFFYAQRAEILRDKIARGLPIEPSSGKMTLSSGDTNTSGASGNPTRDYLITVLNTAQAKWDPPLTSPTPLDVSMKFSINKDGMLNNIQITAGSGKIPPESARRRALPNTIGGR